MKESTKTVLITGGAKGLGLNLAVEYAKDGYTLILTDIDKDSLAEGKDIMKGKGADVHTYQVDVSNKEAVNALAEKVLKKFKHIDILINNAGLGHHQDMEDTTLETWEKLMDVNFWGPLYHIYAFLPSMKERGKGHIVNVSSGQAFFQMPSWGAYAAIKNGIATASEILRYELEKYDVDVTTVYPYMINTGFYNSVSSESLGGKLSMALLPLYSQTAAAVSRTVFKAVERKEHVVMVNPLNYVGKYLHFFPQAAEMSNRVLSAMLNKRSKRKKEKTGLRILERSFNAVEGLVDTITGGVGFNLEEVMIGEHEFEDGEGPKGKFSLQFRVMWGAKNLASWGNPFKDTFLAHDLEGTISIGGWKDEIPCKGTFVLKYFDEQKIRYTFNFKFKKKEYQFIGEKKNIYLWNLRYSHTTCFGEIKEVKTGKLISTSVTHFPLENIPELLGTLRFEKQSHLHVSNHAKIQNAN